MKDFKTIIVYSVHSNIANQKDATTQVFLMFFKIILSLAEF